MKKPTCQVLRNRPIKIEFSMHGVTEKADMWINWWSEDGDHGVDRRVIEFFENAAGKAMGKYREEMVEYELERTKQEREKNERAELARLQAKYVA